MLKILQIHEDKFEAISTDSDVQMFKTAVIPSRLTDFERAENIQSWDNIWKRMQAHHSAYEADWLARVKDWK